MIIYLPICSQSAPWLIVSEHALPSSAKSAERIEGAMIAAGDMVEMALNTQICGDLGVIRKVSVSLIEEETKYPSGFDGNGWDV
jgi:hypothetical protein